jgi:hypothetical protein
MAGFAERGIGGPFTVIRKILPPLHCFPSDEAVKFFWRHFSPS